MDRRNNLDRLIVVFAGDGVASSVLSVTPDGPSAAKVAADLAEAACGRTEGDVANEVSLLEVSFAVGVRADGGEWSPVQAGTLLRSLMS